MKITYDRETDTLTIVFASRTIAESDEDKPGVILDYDTEGKIVAMELLDASKLMDAPDKIEFQAVTAGLLFHLEEKGRTSLTWP